MGKKEKKPLIDIETECPGCKNFLRVKVHRKRTNPVEPPIYEYDTTVELQGNLYKGGKKK